MRGVQEHKQKRGEEFRNTNRRGERSSGTQTEEVRGVQEHKQKRREEFRNTNRRERGVQEHKQKR